MKGSAEDRAAEASGKKAWHDAVLSWLTARRMLPLVRGIVRDILQYRQRLVQLAPEMKRLDRERRSLGWPQRARRYRLQEEILQLERTLEAVLEELDGLGVALLNPDEGQIGFPTLVNDRLAFFSWRPAEENLQFWHFAGEGSRRPIPAAWVKADLGQLSGPV